MKFIDKLKKIISEEMKAIRVGINAYRDYKYNRRMEAVEIKEKNSLRADLLSNGIDV